MAEIDAAGRVTLWSANQSVFRVQANVCEALCLSMSTLRCMTPRVGGGFGNKMEMHVQAMTAALAIDSGRPVKLILTREEDFKLSATGTLIGSGQRPEPSVTVRWWRGRWISSSIAEPMVTIAPA